MQDNVRWDKKEENLIKYNEAKDKPLAVEMLREGFLSKGTRQEESDADKAWMSGLREKSLSKMT